MITKKNDMKVSKLLCLAATTLIIAGCSNNQRILDIANYLANRKEKFYTCHYTGKKAYSQLKEVIGEKLSYLATGSKVEFKRILN